MLVHDSIKTTQQKYAVFSWSRLEQDFPSLVAKQPKTDECTTEKCTTPSYYNYISPRQMN